MIPPPKYRYRGVIITPYDAPACAICNQSRIHYYYHIMTVLPSKLYSGMISICSTCIPVSDVVRISTLINIYNEVYAGSVSMVEYLTSAINT